MTAQVIYLNRLLSVSDDDFRKNNRMQELINENKAKFWHEIKEQGINGYQAWLCYNRFIHANRDRLKLVDNNQNQDED